MNPGDRTVWSNRSRGIRELKDRDFQLRYDNKVNIHSRYTLSIVTPNYNRGKILINLLNSLVNQDCDFQEVEMVVVDDGGSAEEVAMIKKIRLPFRLRYYWQPNQGRRAGRARNIGVKQAYGDIVLFLDSDALASPHLVQDHMDKHCRCQRMAIIGDLADLAKDEQPHFRTYIGLDARPMGFLAFLIHWLKREWLLPWYYRFWDKRMGLSFCSMHASARREDILAVNGFDEVFDGRWGDEDLELGYRLEQSGVNFRWSGKAFVFHQWHSYPERVAVVDNRLKLFLTHPAILKQKTINGINNLFRTYTSEEIQRCHNEEECELIRREEKPARRRWELRYDNQYALADTPRVSLVISTSNRAHFLEGILASVERQTLNPAWFEVVIADNGSTDNSDEIIRSKSCPFRLVHIWQEACGFSMASNRNNGVTVARGGIIVLVDVDALLPENFLEAHWQHHQDRPKIMVAGYCHHLRKGEAQPPTALRQHPHFAWRERRKRWLEDIRQSYFKQLARQGRFAYGTVVTTLNCSFRKHEFEQAGGFDTDFDGLWGDEDTECFYRLERKGFTIEYDHDIRIYHRWHAQSFTRTWRFENRYLFLAKHPELLRYRLINKRLNHYYGWDYCRVRCAYVWSRYLRRLSLGQQKHLAFYQSREKRQSRKEKQAYILLVLIPALLHRWMCRLGILSQDP